MEWLPLLRELDEPLLVETPRNFDCAATQARFNLLAEQLSASYAVNLVAGAGPEQDAARFGAIEIPAEVTRTRIKRKHPPGPLVVVISSFGNLATYHQSTPDLEVHPDDQQRVENALTAVGYTVVPEHILAAAYDGPNADPDLDITWYTRFFDYL